MKTLNEEKNNDDIEGNMEFCEYDRIQSNEKRVISEDFLPRKYRIGRAVCMYILIKKIN